MNAHLSTVEALFLTPNTTAKLQPLGQGVVANFKVNYWRRMIKRLLIDACTSDSADDLKVPLVKATFFASGTWRVVKSQIILNIFKKAGFCGVAAYA